MRISDVVPRGVRIDPNCLESFDDPEERSPRQQPVFRSESLVIRHRIHTSSHHEPLQIARECSLNPPGTTKPVRQRVCETNPRSIPPTTHDNTSEPASPQPRHVPSHLNPGCENKCVNVQRPSPSSSRVAPFSRLPHLRTQLEVPPPTYLEALTLETDKPDDTAGTATATTEKVAPRLLLPLLSWVPFPAGLAKGGRGTDR